MGWFWGAPPGRGGHRRHFRGGRMFDQGDLKYVILQLLADKPRHGYEIIKELEERSGGTYSPSPGTVYPTLTMLEEMGYATAKQEEGGGAKRIYEITQAGRDYLGEHRSTVDDIFERIAEFGSSFFGAGMMEVNHAFKDLGRATYTTAPRYARDAERLQRIKEVLERAAREIEELGK
jgi:Predicted transcriptional regulators